MYIKYGLKAGKKYFFRVRFFRVINGMKVYGKWMKTQKIRATKKGVVGKSWWKGKNAIKYQIKRSMRKKKGYKIVATTKNNCWTTMKMKRGKVYYVKYCVQIKAASGKKVWTKWSKPSKRKAK